MQIDSKQHWETVYATKQPAQMSWTQEVPLTSIHLIQSLAPDKGARIIDVGGGDSKLVDYLIDAGYYNLTVLDVSAKALQRAQERLGRMAHGIEWIEADVTSFVPPATYEIWHDRAVFHFFTSSAQVQAYIDRASAATGSHLILGTFSEAGPQQCSGLPVQQYNANSMQALWQPFFDRVRCHTEDHTTPFGTRQNFLYCHFKKRIR